MFFNLKEDYDFYYKRCFLFIKSYVYNDLVAKDIASESLIKLWELSKTRHIENYTALLFEISKNKALDYLKHEKIKHSAFEEISTLAEREVQIRISNLECSNPEIIFASDMQKIIDKTLSRLPKQTREVFNLYRFEGKEKQDIAKEYSISIKGVDYHVSRATSLLREALKDYLKS